MNDPDDRPRLRATQWRWVYVYVLLIPAVNLSFVYVPTLSIPGGGEWSPMAVVTGLVLVFRDFAQREVGHWIFLPLIIGVYLSYVLAGPELALASGAAFLVSELVDWAVYSFTNRPLSQRVLISSVLAAPVDTIAFLYGASMIVSGILTPLTAITSIASKLLGAYLVYRILRARERRNSAVIYPR